MQSQLVTAVTEGNDAPTQSLEATNARAPEGKACSLPRSCVSTMSSSVSYSRTVAASPISSMPPSMSTMFATHWRVRLATTVHECVCTPEVAQSGTRAQQPPQSDAATMMPLCRWHCCKSAPHANSLHDILISAAAPALTTHLMSAVRDNLKRNINGRCCAAGVAVPRALSVVSPSTVSHRPSLLAELWWC